MSIVIAAAARTPWGKYKGQLATISALQLGQMAVEAAVKRSSIPLEQMQIIFMNETPKLQKENENKFIFSQFIKNAKYMAANGNEDKMMTFKKALEYLKSNQEAAVVMGGISSGAEIDSPEIESLEVRKSYPYSSDVENYISKGVSRYTESQADGIFDSELLPLTVQQAEGKRRIRRDISVDEILTDNCKDDVESIPHCDGAAAVVLTTSNNAENLKLSPLAILKDFAYLQNTSDILSRSRDCVEKLFSKSSLNAQQIQHWEIEDSFPPLVGFLKHHLNLNFDLINPHGGSLILGYSPAVSLIRLITHISHSLNPLQYGCVISSNYRESLALIVQKLPYPFIPDRLPLVTLYTKDPCPLCDLLVEELEHNFSGEYQLQKVFIDTKDNIRFLRLYRFDIPVVFLNNQFLCMHRLNHKLFRKRLDLLKYNNCSL